MGLVIISFIKVSTPVSFRIIFLELQLVLQTVEGIFRSNQPDQGIGVIGGRLFICFADLKSLVHQ